MANREVIALNESTPQLEAAQSGDTYLFPRAQYNDATIFIKEGAAAAADTAAYGQLWVKTATPNLLYFTDDAGTDFQVATLTGTETLTNKTLTTPIIATGGSITDAGGDEYLKFTEATTPVTYIEITSGDTGVAPRVQGAGESNTDLHLLGSGTGNVYVSDGTDPTKDLTFELSGATTAKTMTFTSSHTDDRTLTFPDATDTLVGLATTDTLSNKTLTAPKIATTGSINDAGGDEYLKFTEAATPVTYVHITSGNTGVAPRVQGDGETNTDLHLLGSGTGNVYVSDGTDPTKDLNFELSGATTAKTMTFTSSHTDDRTLTFPDATDTVVGRATTDTLTNKTLTSPTITTMLIDDGDAGLTVTSADQTNASPTATIPDLGDAADTFVMNDTAATLTNKTIAAPTFTGLQARSVTSGITAFAGGGQGSATALTSEINQISTCATGGDSVKLPAAAAGYMVAIQNDGANACDVFPASGDNLGAGVDTAASLASGSGIVYYSWNATNWFSA